MQEEVLNADAADPRARRPPRQRGGRIVGPRDQPRRHSVARGLLARNRMKSENLHTAAFRPRVRQPAHRGRGSPCQLRIAVGLDLDLHRKLTGRSVQQLVEEHRCLVCRGGVAVEQAGTAQIAPRRLVSPAAQRRGAAQPRVVQQHQPSVRRQTDIGLKAVERTGERRLQGRARRVGSRLATEAIRVQRGQRRHNPQGDCRLTLTCSAPVTDPLPSREQARQSRSCDASCAGVRYQRPGRLDTAVSSIRKSTNPR